MVEVTIDVNGKIVNAQILRPANQLLSDAALAAVKQWEYKPTVIEGRAVPVITTVAVPFRLK